MTENKRSCRLAKERSSKKVKCDEQNRKSTSTSNKSRVASVKYRTYSNVEEAREKLLIDNAKPDVYNQVSLPGENNCLFSAMFNSIRDNDLRLKFLGNFLEYYCADYDLTVPTQAYRRYIKKTFPDHNELEEG